jgi:hypothetical protein
MWNEFKQEPNAILDVAPLFTLMDEVTYHRQLTTYKRVFPYFRANGALFNTFSSFDGNNTKKFPNMGLTSSHQGQFWV